MKKLIYSISIVMSLGLINACSASGRYETFTEKMACGKANFTIKSECKKAPDNMSLNECKPQTLTIESDNSVRTASLPELSKSDLVRFPRQPGHPFHGKLDTHSSANWTLIPLQTGQFEAA